MGKYKKLAANSLIFALANFGSKLLLLIFVPFYTHVLGTEEYGTVDTLTTTVSLLLPIFSLVLHEAVLRFSMEAEIKKQCVITNGTFGFVISLMISLISYLFFYKINSMRAYWLLFYIILNSENLNCLLRQYARGIGRVKLFAVNGILNTFILVISNLFFLLWFKLGIVGYLLSMAVSYILCDALLIVKLNICDNVKKEYFNSNILKKMLIYCIPLIPNVVMWWIMNASDRYVIAFFLGLGANGIYAVACKVPSIINTLQQIFMQAWQLSAIEESKNSDEFYNNIYEGLSIVLFLAASGVLIIVKPLLSLVISSNYENVWKYVPWLLIAAVYSGLASFLGTNYIVSMKTGGVLITSAISAGVNIILNIMLTPLIGINGPAFATAVSFFTLWLVRCRSTRDYGIEITQDPIFMFISTGSLVLQAIVIILDVNYSFFINAFLFICLMIFIYYKKRKIVTLFIKQFSLWSRTVLGGRHEIEK